MGLALLIIAGLFVAVLVLLAVPVTISFRLAGLRENRGQVTLCWLFGLVRWQKAIPGASKAAPRRGNKPREKTAKPGPGRKVHGILILLQQSRFRRRLLRFIKDLIRAVQAHDLYLNLRVGLGDPADTGRLWGVIGPVAGLAANLKSAEIRIEPEFTDPVLEVESHGRFRFIPLQFLGLTAAFAASPATIKAWRTLGRSRV